MEKSGVFIDELYDSNMGLNTGKRPQKLGGLAALYTCLTWWPCLRRHDTNNVNNGSFHYKLYLLVASS